MPAVKVRTIHVIDRIVSCDDGRDVQLSEESRHVWFDTTKGLHRFELMESGWLRLRAEPQDPAIHLIRQVCIDPDVASELAVAPWNARGSVLAINEMVERRLCSDELGSWSGLATSYQHQEGIVVQSGVVSRDMLLTIQAFGVTSRLPSIEVNLGVVNDVIVNLP